MSITFAIIAVSYVAVTILVLKIFSVMRDRNTVEADYFNDENL